MIKIEGKMVIRRYLLYLCSLCTVMSSLACFGQDGGPISVVIHPSQYQITSGSKLNAVVVITNVSNDDVDVSKAADNGEAEDCNRIEVRDESGKLLPRIDVQIVNVGGKLRTLPRRLQVNCLPITLKPGEKVEDFATLSNLFDLSKPGTYSVQVRSKRQSESVDPDVKWAFENSNTITITVTK